MAEVDEGIHGVCAHEESARHRIIFLTLIERDRRGMPGDVSCGCKQNLMAFHRAWCASNVIHLIIAAHTRFPLHNFPLGQKVLALRRTLVLGRALVLRHHTRVLFGAFSGDLVDHADVDVVGLDDLSPAVLRRVTGNAVSLLRRGVLLRTRNLLLALHLLDESLVKLVRLLP